MKDKCPNMWRVAPELAPCKPPGRGFNPLPGLLSGEPEILREEDEV